MLAALFTQNLFCAAPVQIDRAILKAGKPVRAIVANSGQANACTGEQGLRNCEKIQSLLAVDLGLQPDEILLISTGVIGAQFDMGKWGLALPDAARNLGSQDAEGFTRAMMTTDAFPKFASRSLQLSGGEIRLCVMAKGAGMICPNMATMLCVALTDAGVERKAWQGIFSRAVNKTFNRVTVDGDTSTNDTILGLANGASGVAVQYHEYLSALEAALGKAPKRSSISPSRARQLTVMPSLWRGQWGIPSWSRPQFMAAMPTGAELSMPPAIPARVSIPGKSGLCYAASNVSTMAAP